MAGSLAALVFPYTEIPDQTRVNLVRIFAKTLLILPLGMEPSPGLEPLVASGQVELIRPDQGLPEAGEIGPLLAEARGWLANIRDPREIAHLKTALTQDSEERSPSALVTAIRNHGREKEQRGILQHLLLHLAAWRDQREQESETAVKALEVKERALRESLAGGLDPEDGDQALYPSLDPLSTGRSLEDPLLGLRLEAWSALFSRTEARADLWVTGPAALRHLAGAYEDRTGKAPVSLNSLEPGERLDRLGEAGLAGLGEGGAGLLDIWQFEPGGLGKALGLDAEAKDLPAFVGEIGWA